MHATIAVTEATCVRLTTETQDGVPVLEIKDFKSGVRACYGPGDTLPWGEPAREFLRWRAGLLDETGQALALRWGLMECPSCAGTGRIALGYPPGERSDWPLDDPVCDRCGGAGYLVR